MTPLEAARKIVADGPRLIEDLWCALCQAPMYTRSFVEATPHADWCPWIAMPKIVAALGVTERMASAIGDAGYPLTDEHWERIVATYMEYAAIQGGES